LPPQRYQAVGRQQRVIGVDGVGIGERAPIRLGSDQLDSPDRIGGSQRYPL
jgi:hypothetical protein